MKKLINYIVVVVLCLSFSQCQDYLQTSSPSNTDDAFVTSSTTETFKVLSWCYANYRQTSIMGVYRWNDPIGSDAETYPESGSTNNSNARNQPGELSVNSVAGGFNGLYTTLARADKVAKVIAGKAQYQKDKAAGVPTEWTQLYGEAITMKAKCYFDLVKHFGDVPFGYENSYVTGYSLTSRFAIYDSLISQLKAVEPLMYKIGDGGITAERFSRTYCDALIGEIALYSGGYQTIRTDSAVSYGDVKFDTKGDKAYGCVYARRTDYMDYYKIAETYLQAAIDNAGTCHLITSDDRSFTDNPFQRNFQYFEDLQVSPESLFQLGNIQGGDKGHTTTSEYPYAFGRPSNGGNSNAAPCKTFGCLRIIPTVYYGDYAPGDERRDASVAVTGSNGDGNERLLSFVPGNKCNGGIATNKWDENRMSPPYTAAKRQSGMDWPVLRMADVMLMLAEAKAVVGDDNSGALKLVNEIRERAFGDNTHDLSGLSGKALLDAVLHERKLELLGEGTRRWDLIRNGLYSVNAIAARDKMQAMIDGLKTNGFYKFANGNIISDSVWTKYVDLGKNTLTYQCATKADSTNGALYPGWRGQYYFAGDADIASKVKGNDHNLSIKGLFKHIAGNTAEGDTLKADGYTEVPWGIDIVKNADAILNNIMGGITSPNDPPRYYWPIPSETLSQSNGNITNGYGLPQQ